VSLEAKSTTEKVEWLTQHLSVRQGILVFRLNQVTKTGSRQFFSSRIVLSRPDIMMKVLINLHECPLLSDIDGAQHTVSLFHLANPGLHEVIVVFEAGDLSLKQVPHLHCFHREHFQGRTYREHLHVP
jgi:hypothetical protein